MPRLTGLCAFPITPASPEGRVDLGALRRLVAPLVEAGVDSIGLLGSTGTYAYLSRDERRRALEAVLDVAAGRVPVVVGVGALRTDEAVRLAQDARAAGAAIGLIAPVSYTPLTADEVFEHVAEVARAGGLPLCLYDNPATTHFRFEPALVARLARLDGIVALKSPAGPPGEVAAQVATLRAHVPAGFPLGFSGDWNCAKALLAGGEAWYSVAAGLFPRPCLALVRAAQAGDRDEVRRLNARFEPLWALFRAHSSLRVMYAAVDLLGLGRPEPPRPILPLTDDARGRVAAALAEAGLI